jgi:tetratricopeptide (TPR) repeat protein
MGNFDKSVEIFKKSLALDSKDAGAYYNLSLILVKTGRRAEALQVLQRAVVDVPEGSPGLQNLRELLERLKS